MNSPDPFHGQGGTYVVLPDGRRVPSDPVSGEPLLPADPMPDVPATPVPSRTKSTP